MGVSTSGNVSFGENRLAGSILVPRPAAINTASLIMINSLLKLYKRIDHDIQVQTAKVGLFSVGPSRITHGEI